MRSKIVNSGVDVATFEDDIKRILAFSEDNQSYTEFCIGDWKTYVLRNSSGLDGDGLVAESDLPLKVTPRGAGLTAVNAWIDSFFETENLRLVRVHSMGDGVLIPHRDFLEFDERASRWLRLHVPIRTNDHCYHLEEGDAFHMRVGEIWHLDASRLHSATNNSDDRRLNLCLDFDIGEASMASVFRKPAVLDLQAPMMIKRPALNAAFVEGLMGLSKVINESNYRDIVGLLSKVHFYRDAPLSQFFDWLVEITKRSGSVTLLKKSIDFCRFLRAERVMHERFAL